jgi:hypothetical protein
MKVGNSALAAGFRDDEALKKFAHCHVFLERKATSYFICSPGNIPAAKWAICFHWRNV